MTNGIYLSLAASAVLLAACAPQTNFSSGASDRFSATELVNAGVPCERISATYRSSVKGCETVVIARGPSMTEESLIDLNLKFQREIEPTVNFDFDKDNLRADARAILDRQAEWIKRYPNLRFSVFGHTDLVGSLDYNFDLAKRRADATLNYLLSRGVMPGQLEAIVSFGETQPRIDTSRREERNRRTVTEVAGYLRAGGVSLEAIPCSYLDASYAPTYTQCYPRTPVAIAVAVAPVPAPPMSVGANYTSTTQSGQASISVAPDGTTTSQASGTTGSPDAPSTATSAVSVAGPTGGSISTSASAAGAAGPANASLTDNGDGTSTATGGGISVTGPTGSF
jgi:outer membrane protein OmpA-like peptidoglycan-associated protein